MKTTFNEASAFKARIAELESALAERTQERDEESAELDKHLEYARKFSPSCHNVYEVFDRLAQQRDALAAAFERYGGHDSNCAMDLCMGKGEVRECTCGYANVHNLPSDAIAAYRAQIERETLEKVQEGVDAFAADLPTLGEMLISKIERLFRSSIIEDSDAHSDQ